MLRQPVLLKDINLVLFKFWNSPPCSRSKETPTFPRRKVTESHRCGEKIENSFNAEKNSVCMQGIFLSTNKKQRNLKLPLSAESILRKTSKINFGWIQTGTPSFSPQQKSITPSCQKTIQSLQLTRVAHCQEGQISASRELFQTSSSQNYKSQCVSWKQKNWMSHQSWWQTQSLLIKVSGCAFTGREKQCKAFDCEALFWLINYSFVLFPFVGGGVENRFDHPRLKKKKCFAPTKNSQNPKKKHEKDHFWILVHMPWILQENYLPWLDTDPRQSWWGRVTKDF